MIVNFLAIKCFDNEKLHIIHLQTIAYIHALFMDSILNIFEDSINALAHGHERAMIDLCTKMKLDSFRF